MEKMKTEALLRVENLTKVYGKNRILDGLSFSVRQGETIAVTGKSGAGKSTLLSILGTLDRPTAGDLFFAGQRLTRRNSRAYRRDAVGFVFQDSCLVEEWTAYENVLSAVRLSGSKEDPMQYLSLVGLAEKGNLYPEKLSGGEARRVSVARALAKRPQLLLLDEPTEGLDGETGRAILELTLELCHSRGLTVLMVTHNEEHACRMSKRFHLADGKLTEGGTDF